MVFGRVFMVRDNYFLILYIYFSPICVYERNLLYSKTTLCVPGQVLRTARTTTRSSKDSHPNLTPFNPKLTQFKPKTVTIEPENLTQNAITDGICGIDPNMLVSAIGVYWLSNEPPKNCNNF